jgi:tetratricopeptide (TPR) repeat protein
MATAEADDTLSDVRLTQAAEHEWDLVRTLVDFADKLVVVFAFADRYPIRVLRARMRRFAGAEGMPFRLAIGDDPDFLRDEALATVLRCEAEHEVVWFEAFGREADLHGAWFFAAQRWNEHREVLRRSGIRALIVSAPIWAKPVIRLAAPDLWSITNLVIEPGGSARLSDLTWPEEHKVSAGEGTDEAKHLAALGVLGALALAEDDPRRPWAIMEAIGSAVEAGALDAARQAADALNLSPGGLDHLDAAGAPPDVGARFAALGGHLAALGRNEEAVAAGARAVAIYRRRAGGTSRTASLAASLNFLGHHLFALGRKEEAQATLVEAVALYRRLSARWPEPFEPVLGSILNLLGMYLSELGRLEEALQPSGEAVDLYRRLTSTQQEPVNEHSPYLASSLNGLAIHLSKLGRSETALYTASEAVELYRRLVQAGRVEERANLAVSLTNLGTLLSAMGRVEDALAATEEAADHYRSLAQDSPETFLPRLAVTLRYRGHILATLGRTDEARRATDEALDLTWPLFLRQPTAFADNIRNLLTDCFARLDGPPSPELLERQHQFDALTKNDP